MCIQVPRRAPYFGICCWPLLERSVISRDRHTLKGSWNLGFDGHQPVTILDHHDYIVVGSGPGGAPLAARSGLAGYKVLMIETGRDEAADNNDARVLIFNAKASEDERLLWAFYVRLLDRFYAEARC